LFNIGAVPKDNYYFRYVPEGFTSTILTNTTSQTVTQYVENPNPNDKLTLKYYVGTNGSNDQLSIQYLINGNWTVLTGVFNPVTIGGIYTHESDYAGWPTKLKLYAPSSDGHNYRKLTLNGIIVAQKDDVGDVGLSDANAGFFFDSNSQGNRIEKIWDVPQPNTNWVERDGTNSLDNDIRLDLVNNELRLGLLDDPLGWDDFIQPFTTVNKLWIDLSNNPNAVFREYNTGWRIVETGSHLYDGDFDQDDILVDVTDKVLLKWNATEGPYGPPYGWELTTITDLTNIEDIYVSDTTTNFIWSFRENKWNKITEYYAQLPTPDLSMNTLYLDTYFNKVFLYDNSLIKPREPLGWELKMFYQQNDPPENGREGEIYIDISTNKLYYWNSLWKAPSIPIGWSELLVNDKEITDIYTNANEDLYIHFSNKLYNGIQLGWQINRIMSDLPNWYYYDIFIMYNILPVCLMYSDAKLFSKFIVVGCPFNEPPNAEPLCLARFSKSIPEFKFLIIAVFPVPVRPAKITQLFLSLFTELSISMTVFLNALYPPSITGTLIPLSLNQDFAN